MTKAAIIDGQLIDVRNAGQHKDAILKIAVPAERAQAVIDAFGWPTMADPVPVAVAKLDVSKEILSEKPRRRFRDLPPAQQAAMACGDPVFQQFLLEKGFIAEKSSDEAAQAIRRECAIDSRAQILPDTAAGKIWADLYNEFDAWRRV